MDHPDSTNVTKQQHTRYNISSGGLTVNLKFIKCQKPSEIKHIWRKPSGHYRSLTYL